MSSKQYISTTQAAKKLGVTRVTIFNMIRDGRIKAVKVGRNYIIPKNFQEAFIKPYKHKIVPILKKHGVKRASLFGSTVRNQRKKKSDMDVLVEYAENTGLFEVIDLKHELEEKLGMKVDLVSFKYIHKYLKESILNHQVPIL